MKSSGFGSPVDYSCEQKIDRTSTMCGMRYISNISKMKETTKKFNFHFMFIRTFIILSIVITVTVVNHSCGFFYDKIFLYIVKMFLI